MCTYNEYKTKYNTSNKGNNALLAFSIFCQISQQKML